ncbi:MAG: spore maturation protein CgeB [Lachnospiraceae bacterium]|nr:spore maturation protein CgeB [Lachnospiraceae bacterium]
MNKKVLIYRYNSICEPFVIRALQSLGVHVDEVTEAITNKDMSTKEEMLLVSNKLTVNRYDAVYSINFYPVISEVCRIYKVPYICQTVDCPVFELYSHSIKNECNRIFLFDYAQYLEFQPKNPDCIFYLPLAADVEHYDSVIKTITPADKHFASDVAFVGSLYSEKSPYSKAELSPHLRGYLDGVANAQLKVYGYNFLREVLTQNMVDEYKKNPDFYNFPEKSDKNEIAFLADGILGYRVAELERERLLGLLSEYFNVDLYTASDTTNLPKVHNRGTATTLTEMPKIFHLSKINLNFTIKPIRTGLPLRIWDIMGCGGFVLTNYQEEIAEYFEVGKDIAVFGSEEELIEKTRYYLEHEAERAAIARNGYMKVREYHTWEKRMELVLETVFGQI